MYECHDTKQICVGTVSTSVSMLNSSVLDVLILTRIAAVASAKSPHLQVLCLLIKVL